MYFDEDVLGVAKILGQLRTDVTYPGDPGAALQGRIRPACPIERGSPDSDWIPRVAREGWLVVTRDSRIQRHTAELAAVHDSGARMVALSGREATSNWTQLEMVMTQWRAIESLLGLPGPFVYAATRTGPLRLIPLTTSIDTGAPGSDRS